MNHLRKKRIEQGITQKALGKRLNVSQCAISDWESQRRYPSHNHGRKLVQYFSAPSLEWLMESEPVDYCDSNSTKRQ